MNKEGKYIYTRNFQASVCWPSAAAGDRFSCESVESMREKEASGDYQAVLDERGISVKKK